MSEIDIEARYPFGAKSFVNQTEHINHFNRFRFDSLYLIITKADLFSETGFLW
ncbi:MAG: hypothetical protein ACHQQQ_02545 [Bacteroidota bacterium]